ncbi:hypothetical protein ACGFJC_47515 [Nonomuraea fuscirosea]|uniref:hypothetical protein n=1 Tax=Nonomuraea fuscirosea TaxID=1291556 RepID=UPI00371A3C40
MSTAADSPWRPLRERLAGLAGERALVKGTPAYMVQPLQEWLTEAILSSLREFEHDLGRALHLRLRRTDIVVAAGRGGMALVSLKGDDLLEALDAALAVNQFMITKSPSMARSWWQKMVMDLFQILEDGGSAWRITDDVGGLTSRVDETVAQAAREAMQSAPSDARQHLRRAWDAAYGYKPDATLAYSEAVKAVEAVVVPMAIPNDRLGTLGKALAHIKQTAAKWTIAVDQSGTPASSDVLIAMLALVWHGQSDRHAGPNTAPVTLESAQTVLHAAATLVQWFTSGAVKKAP